MRFYRVHLPDVDTGVSAGFEWFSRKADAARAVRKHNDVIRGSINNAELMVVDIQPTKAGILGALNRYADHPDNG